VTLLLDTHAFLWFAAGDRRLSRVARAALEQDDAELAISAASVWEIAIKASLDRLQLPTTVEKYIDAKIGEGYRVMPIDWQHTAAVKQLPFYHRDPFDRLLAAQALIEETPLVTRDRIFRKYGVETIW
jgi:PIN domain nuclease of toxin-antitoxin system